MRKGGAGKQPTAIAAPALAKLRAPRAESAIARPAWFRQLDRVFRRTPIAWLPAPAGAGKSMLAASFLHARRRRHLWYQLDARDADPAVFFHYLREAVLRLSPRARARLPAFGPDNLANPGNYTRGFFEQLGTSLRPPLLLVLDNYQDLPDDSPLHELLAEGMRVLPDGMQILVLSRSEPRAAFASLMVAQRLTLLEGGTLAFTLAETRRIAQRYRFRQLTAGALASLHARTRGWAAGAVLMLEQAARERDITPNFDRPVAQALFDYFAAEVLAQAPAAQQKVLLETALLSEVSVGNAVALTGEPSADRTLQEFARKHYFTYRLSGAAPVYQYHPLFREFLLAQLQQRLTPAELAALRRSAAVVAEAHGRVEDAAELLQQAGAWPEMSAFVLRHASMLVGKGQLATLEGWLRALPDAATDAEPWLLYWLGVCRMPYDTDEARVQFETAFVRFRKRRMASGNFLAWTGAVESVMFGFRDFHVADPWIDSLDGLLREYPEFPDPATGARLACAMLIALSLRQPQHPRIAEWRERVHALFCASRDARFRAFAGVYLSVHYTWTGDFARAAFVIEQLRPLAQEESATPLARVTARVSEAMVLVRLAEHDVCDATIADGLALAGHLGVKSWLSQLHSQAATNALSRGDAERAETSLHEMRAVLDESRYIDVCMAHQHAAGVALLRRNTLAAVQHATEALALASQAGSPFHEALSHIGLVHALRVQGNGAQARLHLDAAQRIAHAMHSRLLEFMCLLIAARLALDTGAMTEADEALRAGLALGREQGYVNTYWWLAETMESLCARALAADIEAEYVIGLIRRRGLVPPADGETHESWPYRVTLRTLGHFELTVDGKPFRFEGRTRKKTLELLKALIALGAREVSESRLCDALWPGAEADDARASLKVTLHRLRQVIGHEALVLHESKLTLDPRYVRADVWSFERLANTLLEADGAMPVAASMQAGERMLAFYRGAFLAGDEQVFVLGLRERLRAKLLRAIAALADSLLRGGAHDAALSWYERGIEAEPLVEPFHQGLMRACLALNRPAGGLAAYERARRIFATQLQVTLSPATEALARALRQAGS
jgi:LuxR family maltose regulon positive regulatory protein